MIANVTNVSNISNISNISNVKYLHNNHVVTNTLKIIKKRNRHHESLQKSGAWKSLLLLHLLHLIPCGLKKIGESENYGK